MDLFLVSLIFLFSFRSCRFDNGCVCVATKFLYLSSVLHSSLDIQQRRAESKMSGHNGSGLSNRLSSSVGTVLSFQFSPGFGSEASVPVVSRYRFWYLGSGFYFLIPGFPYWVFMGLFAFFLFWYWFGPIFDSNFGSKSGGT